MAKIGIVHNLPALGGLVGVLEAMVVGFDSDSYLEGILRDAHSDPINGAALAHDKAATAKASDGSINHMYEYGMVGQTGASARLWEHTMTGQGGHQKIDWNFRAAVVPNPPHTTKSTGIPQSVLSKLSNEKHVFYERASVVERGLSVHIKAKEEGGWMFVPASRKEDGYIWTKGSVDFTHENYKGNFMKWSTDWWLNHGDVAIQERVRASIERDVNNIVEKELDTLSASTINRVSVAMMNAEYKRKFGKVKHGIFKVSLNRANKRRG